MIAEQAGLAGGLGQLLYYVHASPGLLLATLRVREWRVDGVGDDSDGWCWRDIGECGRADMLSRSGVGVGERGWRCGASLPREGGREGGRHDLASALPPR